MKILLLALVCWIILIFAFGIFLFRDFSWFVLQRAVPFVRRKETFPRLKLVRPTLPKQFIDWGEYVTTWFAVLLVAIFSFLAYKMVGAIVAHLLSGDLISFFRIMRGVYTIESDIQNPLSLNHLLSGLVLTPLLQFGMCYLIYEGIKFFMLLINRKYRTAVFYWNDLLYFGFCAVGFILFLEILMYSQAISFASSMANSLNLIMAKLSNVCYFLAIAHAYLLKSKSYEKVLPEYLILEGLEAKVVYNPLLTLSVTFIIGIILNVPLYMGMQFSSNNWVLIISLGASSAIFFWIYKAFLSKGYNYVGSVMFLETQLPLEGQVSFVPLRRKGLLLIPGIALTALLILKAKLFFFLLFYLLVLSSALIITHILLHLIGLLISVIYTIIVLKQNPPPITSKALFNYLIGAGKYIGLSISLSIMIMACVFTFMSFFPKNYVKNIDKDYIAAVLDDENTPIYLQVKGNNDCIVIDYDKVSPFLLKCLYIQEDRGFLNQNDWFFNPSNWHGLSTSSLYRMATGVGGGSNLNMQLIKNEAFEKGFPQDFQRKLAEALTSYQLSSQLPVEEIVIQYLNKVSMHGGKGQSGVMMASLSAFNLPLSQLNELEQLYLVGSLPHGGSLPTKNGRILYKDVNSHAEGIKDMLVSKASLWYSEGLLSKKEFNKLKKPELRFAEVDYSVGGFTSTREFVKKQITNDNATPKTYRTYLSQQNQARMQNALNRFDSQFSHSQKKAGCELYSAAIVVDVESGNIIGHYGSNGVSDMVQFGSGYPMASLIKPFVFLELLEMGFSPDVSLYDGKIGNHDVVNNVTTTFSMQSLGMDEILSQSLNAPFCNLWQITPALPLFNRMEGRFAGMNISKDSQLNLDDSKRKGEHEMNYALGSRNMTLFDMAQLYQTLFNHGKYVQLSAIKSSYNPYSGLEEDIDQEQKQVYKSKNADRVKKALSYTLEDGTGRSLKKYLQKNKRLYIKTGTSDKAKHGYTVICDGKPW